MRSALKLDQCICQLNSLLDHGLDAGSNCTAAMASQGLRDG